MTATNTLDFYDTEATHIERYSSKKSWERRYHTRRLSILKTLLERSIARDCNIFADVGCGTGEYLVFSQRFVPDVYGIDLSRQYLRRCKSCKPSGLLLADIRFLPFRDRAFDCVLCSEVIEHVKDQDKSISEVLRVARKVVLFSTPNQGLTRTLLSYIARPLVGQVDRRVGHIRILRFADLIGKVKNDHWKITSAFTIEVFQPTLDSIRLPIYISPIVNRVELVLHRLLPTWGSVSFVTLERKGPLSIPSTSSIMNRK
jgi:SAM-dependent methyltransferase